jgi:hypothetical protein
MAAASIVLGVLAVVFIGLGVLATPIPVLGTVLSFTAPALALAAVVTGGVAMSRAKREGRSAEGATAGVVVGALAFVPALMVALTCGVCNALCSASTLQGGPVRVRLGGGFGPDSGVPFALPPPPGAKPPASPEPSTPPPAPAPGDPAAPPPAFPPPPIGAH